MRQIEYFLNGPIVTHNCHLSLDGNKQWIIKASSSDIQIGEVESWIESSSLDRIPDVEPGESQATSIISTSKWRKKISSHFLLIPPEAQRSTQPSSLNRKWKCAKLAMANDRNRTTETAALREPTNTTDDGRRTTRQRWCKWTENGESGDLPESEKDKARNTNMIRCWAGTGGAQRRLGGSASATQLKMEAESKVAFIRPQAATPSLATLFLLRRNRRLSLSLSLSLSLCLSF